MDKKIKRITVVNLLRDYMLQEVPHWSGSEDANRQVDSIWEAELWLDDLIEDAQVKAVAKLKE